MTKPPPSAADGGIFAATTRLPLPATRPLAVYAFDPSRGRRLGNTMTVDVAYEPLAPGPVGERFAVVDYDGTQNTYYTPVNLELPAILMRGGLAPSEVDPRFHQQMVYAVASETLERFQTALGRRVHWRRPSAPDGTDIDDRPNRLYLHPHAMAQANAFYSADAHAILFGYFKASADDAGHNLPGQTVFTCLSHDIIAHETTHAIVDGIREHLMEPTNIDVAAFHEAFADLAALFRHFAHSETLLDTLQKTGGKLHALTLKTKVAGEIVDPEKKAQIQADTIEANPLLALATQFGEASAMHGGLRSALGSPPTPDDIKTKTEPHDRGSVLVAAVFDAYFTVYLRKTEPLFKLWKPAGDGDDLPAPLAELLAEAASKTAETFFTLCARALDYCPPVDLTFGDFLRALITADLDFYPNDTDGVRDAIMQSFRLRGILPDDARYFSEASLCWPELRPGALPVPRLRFGDPNGLTSAEKDFDGAILRAWAQKKATLLGFDPAFAIKAESFHPMFRVDQNGKLLTDMIVELVQTREIPRFPGSADPATLTMHSGVTLIVARPPQLLGRRAQPYVRFAIAKHYSPEREQRQRHAFVANSTERSGPASRFGINFALLHAGD